MIQKDYCGQNIEDLLAEVGFPIRDYQFCLQGPGVLIREKVSLYEAQKWLRKEKTIIVEANFNLMYKGQPRFSWRILYNLTQHKGAYYTFDSVYSKEDYDSPEEALSEGIKEAIKILKDEEAN